MNEEQKGKGTVVPRPLDVTRDDLEPVSATPSAEPWSRSSSESASTLAAAVNTMYKSDDEIEDPEFEGHELEAEIAIDAALARALMKNAKSALRGLLIDTSIWLDLAQDRKQLHE
jgi:hypothetical protein